MNLKRAAYIVLTILALANGWWGLLYFQTTEGVRITWALAMWLAACAFLVGAMTLDNPRWAELEAEYHERRSNGEPNYPE